MGGSTFDAETARLLSAYFKCQESQPLIPILEQARGISRQAASAQVQRWIKTGLVQASAAARPKLFQLYRLEVLERDFPFEEFDEHVVWTDFFRPVLARSASASAMKVWDYGVTEMLNNAKEHSEGTRVRVGLSMTGAYGIMFIADNGEGIFKRITRLCRLADERQALLELAKGKLTTDPSRHSGEGIFLPHMLSISFGFSLAICSSTILIGTTAPTRLSRTSTSRERQLCCAFAMQPIK